MGPILGSVLGSVGSSLVGKLFGSNKSESRTNLKALVRDAQEAGFNPLTVLQATGGSGWGSQVSANDLDIGTAAAAAAIQGITDYWSNQQNRDLMDAQIDLAKAQAQSIRGSAQAAPFGATVQDLSTRETTSQTLSNRSPIAMTTSPKAPSSKFGGPMTPDMTVYNDREEPVEFETWGMGAAMQGQLPAAFDDLFSRNYPRMHEIASSYWDANKTVYDGVKDEVQSIRDNGFGAPRLLTNDEEEQLKRDSWFYRNLGIDVRFRN